MSEKLADFTTGCIIRCGLCRKEIGSQPLQEHFESGECWFMNGSERPVPAFYYWPWPNRERV